jgi:hypothetical protein
VKRPKAQALLETSAAVIGSLIKAFDDWERSLKLFLATEVVTSIEIERITLSFPLL